MRLFVAVGLQPGPAVHLAAALGTAHDPRWHVTLAFLGQCDPGPVAASLRQVRAAPFDLALAGSGTFGGRVLWAGVGPGRAELGALARQVAVACRGAGVVLEDRPYRPHLTVRRGRDLDPAPLADYAGPAFRLEAFSLVESRDGQHVEVERFDLRED